MRPEDANVLVIEGDQDVRDQLVIALGGLGFTKVSLAVDLKRALKGMKNAEYDLVFVDTYLSRHTALETLSAIREYIPEGAVIYMANSSYMEGVEDLMNHGATNCLLKNYSVSKMKLIISDTWEQFHN